MTILLLCRWPLHDVLTVSAVLPQVAALVQLKKADKVILVTLEEKKASLEYGAMQQHPVLASPKVQWIPLFAVPGKVKLVKQVAEMLLHVRQLCQLVTEHNIDALIGYGSPAGALVYKVWQKTQVPFYVSSFEPHARYMMETGVWRATGVKFKFQEYWEKKQKQYAVGLMPVSHNYGEELLTEGLSPAKIVTVPCTVNLDATKFELSERNRLRQLLGWQHAIIGIYAGKYGGLYYQKEAFAIYRQCFAQIPGFRLLVLTPQATDEIVAQLVQEGIDTAKAYVAFVPHQQVNSYLSAADFAFATIKSYHSARYCSPVKIGEYWANGLPVLLTEGVGDDSDIIRAEGGGALFNLQEQGSVERAIARIREILKDPQHRQQIPELARKYRSPETILKAYRYFLEQQQEEEA